jgi:hypothetical protein
MGGKWGAAVEVEGGLPHLLGIEACIASCIDIVNIPRLIA